MTPSFSRILPTSLHNWGPILHFYDVALRYAPTPQAKGKIERRHLYYQGRLPALFAAENIIDLGHANRLLDELLPHANANEVHRELGITPRAARDQALAQKQSVLRPVPACPWWPFVFSQQTRVRVGDDGKVPVGHLRASIDAPPRSTVIRCQRPDGDIYFLRFSPDPQKQPIILLHHPIF